MSDRIFAWVMPWIIGITIYLGLIMGGAPAAACIPPDKIELRLPDGLTAHLENPQAYQDSDCVIFAATRPNSGVGGLVWKQYPDGHTEVIAGYQPWQFYALGELVVWDDGRLRYVTVEQDDHSKIVVYRVPGWEPWTR